MKIEFSVDFKYLLGEIISYIAKDKPLAARKFKKNLMLSIKKDLQFPYNFKKSIYFEDILIRDYVFKVYTITYKIEENDVLVLILGIIKNKNTY